MRPVSARALKSAGDTLRPHLAGARVLDLYAGHGRFGRMALDEGASEAVFVEKDRAHAAALLKDLKGKGRVETADVFQWLAKTPQPFELIFADPPFPDWDETLAARLFASVTPWLVPEGIFLVKTPKRVVASPPIGAYRLWKSTPFGESALQYFIYEP